MRIVFLVMMFVTGCCIGSFLCCQARRLHLRSTKPGQKLTSNRSICLNCKKQLKWYDNLPIISWLVLHGKCRHCHHKIGLAELMSEIGTGIAYLVLGLRVDLYSNDLVTWLIFIAMIVFITLLSFLAIFDGIYGELPTLFLNLAIICALVVVCLREYSLITTTGFNINFILDPFYAVLMLGGLYLFLYLISKGKWVGNGDWLLGVSIGLILSSPWLALIELTISNLLACIIMYPIVRKNKTTKVYFGPFMVIAFVIVFAFADFLQNMI